MTTMSSQQDCIDSRSVLWFMSFTAFLIQYCLRVNVSIAIVDMVETKSNGPTNITGECFTRVVESNISNLYLMDEMYNKTLGKKYAWDEFDQGLILGSLFITTWACQMPGGVFAQKYSSKLIIGLSNMSISIASLFTPWMADWGVYAMVIVRLIQGIGSGISLSAFAKIFANWSPPNERSKLASSCVGATFGAILALGVSGYFILWFGWESVFYIFGALGVAHSLAWWFLVYDTPSKHPRISPEEKNYIVTSIGSTLDHKRVATPWKDLLRSRALWLIAVAHMGAGLGYTLFMTLTPTYFKFIFGWDVSEVGILTALPQVTHLLSSFPISALGDYLMRRNIMTRTNVRKLGVFLSNVLPALVFFCLAFTGCDFWAALILISISTAANSGWYIGTCINVVDIAPNIVGVTYAIINMMSLTVNIFTIVLIGSYTVNNQTVEGWNNIFITCGVFVFISGLPHLIWGDADVQPWNSPPARKRQEEEPLKNGKELTILTKETILTQ